MPARSLKELATQTALRNINDIHDLGELPYQIVQPILVNIKSAAQLAAVEDNSPHLLDHTEHTWRLLIHKHLGVRDLPTQTSKWRRVYQELEKEREQKKQALKASLDSLKQQKEAVASVSLNRVVAPPRRRMQERRPATAGQAFLQKTRKETNGRLPIFLQGRVAPPSRARPRLSTSDTSRPSGLTSSPSSSTPRPPTGTMTSPTRKPCPPVHPICKPTNAEPTGGKRLYSLNDGRKAKLADRRREKARKFE